MMHKFRPSPEVAITTAHIRPWVVFCLCCAFYSLTASGHTYAPDEETMIAVSFSSFAICRCYSTSHPSPRHGFCGTVSKTAPSVTKPGASKPICTPVKPPMATAGSSASTIAGSRMQHRQPCRFRSMRESRTTSARLPSGASICSAQGDAHVHPEQYPIERPGFRAERTRVSHPCPHCPFAAMSATTNPPITILVIGGSGICRIRPLPLVDTPDCRLAGMHKRISSGRSRCIAPPHSLMVCRYYQRARFFGTA